MKIIACFLVSSEVVNTEHSRRVKKAGDWFSVIDGQLLDMNGLLIVMGILLIMQIIFLVCVLFEIYTLP